MKGSYKIIYSNEALNDLREIYSYIAFTLLVQSTAQEQVSRIRKKILSLDFMPSKYKIVSWEPWKSMKIHQLPIDNYIIFYLIDDEKMLIKVIRIMYAGRDIPSEIHTSTEEL